MTEIRVLPVGKGDACFVRGRRGSYLFDGGDVGCGITDMLNERGIRKIRAAICTGPTRARLGGLWELLLNDFQVGEIWLPASIAELLDNARYFDGNWSQWAKLPTSGSLQSPTEGLHRSMAHRRSRHEAVAVLMRLACISLYGLDEDLPGLPSATESDNSTQRRSDVEAFYIALNKVLTRKRAKSGWLPLPPEHMVDDPVFSCAQLLLMESAAAEHKVVLLANVIMTAVVLERKKPVVRFVKNTRRQTDHLIPYHPIICLNGHTDQPSMEPAPCTAQHIERHLRTMGNQSSGLVYQYGEGRCSILVCGMNNFTFVPVNNTITLDRPTVILAPQQGATKCNRVYGLIRPSKGNDIWIRTHASSVRKISPYYQQKQDKLCLVNCRYQTQQEILLRFEGHAWRKLSGSACSECRAD